MRLVAPVAMKGWQIVVYALALLFLAQLAGLGGPAALIAALTLGDIGQGRA